MADKEIKCTDCEEQRAILEGQLTKQKLDNERRISERVPIRHALMGVIATVGIITTIITMQSSANNRLDEKLDRLSESVAVMNAVNEERKRQSEFQNRLLNVLIESLQELRSGHDEHTSNRYGKPGP